MTFTAHSDNLLVPILLIFLPIGSKSLSAVIPGKGLTSPVNLAIVFLFFIRGKFIFADSAFGTFPILR